ncbi:MAG: hypothetical protein JRN39_07260 [Nitrososphaerota archaeon]|nr:hypothetical protein [Nitrososphaerota archaeon]
MPGAKYAVYCETEKKQVTRVAAKGRALYFAYKHRLRSHDVSIVGPDGRKEVCPDSGWTFRCENCGKVFPVGADWVAHVAGRVCLSPPPAG